MRCIILARKIIWVTDILSVTPTLGTDVAEPRKIINKCVFSFKAETRLMNKTEILRIMRSLFVLWQIWDMKEEMYETCFIEHMART